MTYNRTIPAGVQRELERSESAEALLVFLEITHQDLVDPIRIVSDPKDFTYSGELFQGFTFSISLLSDDDSAPQARLRVQNVDQVIGNTLRMVTNPARINLWVIAASEFDLTADPRTELSTAAITYQASSLYLVDVEVDAMFVSGTMRLWDYSQEQWPATMGTIERLPGLFR